MRAAAVRGRRPRYHARGRSRLRRARPPRARRSPTMPRENRSVEVGDGRLDDRHVPSSSPALAFVRVPRGMEGPGHFHELDSHAGHSRCSCTRTTTTHRSGRLDEKEWTDGGCLGGDSPQKGAGSSTTTCSRITRPSGPVEGLVRQTGTRSPGCGASSAALCVILIWWGAGKYRTTRQKDGVSTS